MFRFIHVADIHLDSPLRGLEQYEGAPVEQIRGASRIAFENLTRLAIEEKVDFVLIAGDLYDGDWRDYRTGLHFVGQMAKLREAGIPVYLIAGNHDAANKMTRSLALPSNVQMFSSDAAHTVAIESIDVAIHGQSFSKAAVTDDLSAAYPTAVKGAFNIGILHTCGPGREGHERYAPCSLETLRNKDYAYWALGHIHKRETLCEAPFIGFSGNIQGRHIRETGPKGCLLVEVNTNREIQTHFQPLDVLRWESLRIDLGEIQHLDDALLAARTSIEQQLDASEHRLTAMRIEFFGSTSIHETLQSRRHRFIQDVRASANDVGLDHAWIEKVVIKTTATRDNEVSFEGLSDDAIGEIHNVIAGLKNDRQAWLNLDVGIDDLERKLPTELKDIIKDLTDGDFERLLLESESRLMDVLRAAR